MSLHHLAQWMLAGDSPTCSEFSGGDRLGEALRIGHRPGQGCPSMLLADSPVNVIYNQPRR